MISLPLANPIPKRFCIDSFSGPFRLALCRLRGLPILLSSGKAPPKIVLERVAIAFGSESAGGVAPTEVLPIDPGDGRFKGSKEC